MSTFTLHVQHLCKRFGAKTVFTDLSFSHEGGVLGIAGPNGSGKSTLLRCLAGLLSARSGEITWEMEHRKFELRELKLHIGYAAPYINLYHELSCRENLQFLLDLRNETNTPQTVDKVLMQTAMLQFAEQLFGNLSTGQQQRMRLAAALLHQPNILFLDEPGSNLDEKGRKLIKSIISEFKATNKLVILASNNPEELELCDSVFSVEERDFVY